MGGGVLQGCMLMTPFWCCSHWIYKPTLSSITLCSNNIKIVIENWQDEDEGELPNHKEEDIFAQDERPHNSLY